MAPPTRRDFLKTLGAGALAVSCVDWLGCAPNDLGPPNIVVVMADDHRHDMMSCAGHPWVRTPQLDRLAENGVRFTNAFVTTSLCSPSRASFLTGTHAHTHGVVANSQNDPGPATPTIAETLQRAGYETAFIGKWHMGRWSTPRRGFDHWVSFNGQGDYERNTLNVDGLWELSEHYVTDELTDRATAFLQRPHDRPFLMMLSHKAVHAPCRAAPRHRGLYLGEDVGEADDPREDLDLKPDWGGRKARTDRADLIREYARTLAAVDDSVGKVRAQLTAAGLAENTVVIYTADNGFMQGDHGGLWDKRAAYDASIRIPLLMVDPRRGEKGATCEAMVLNIDLAPTLAALAGVPSPATHEGRSWLPQVEGDPGRDAFLYEYFAERGEVPTSLAVRSTAWKYIVYPDRPDLPSELYDLIADPEERTNLADDPEQRERIRKLESRLSELSTPRNEGAVSSP